MHRFVKLTLLEVDAGEPERGFVSHRFIDGTLKHSLNGAPCAVVHAVVEFEVADREFGVINVVVQRVEFGLVKTVVHGELGVEPLECIEVLPLEGMKECLAEIEVSQVLRRSSTLRATSLHWPITRNSAASSRTKGKSQDCAESD